MEVNDFFMPTAGVVGFLPMVTYFFMVVAMFAFTGYFIFSLAVQSTIRLESQGIHVVTAVITGIAASTYYLTQVYYNDLLRELATVSDATDRQTLIRESYNAIGQFRYMNWFVTSPLLLLQIVFSLTRQLSAVKRSLVYLLTTALFLYFASYVGHQQLSFDNEIQAGMKISWGFIALAAYGFILFLLRRIWNEFRENTPPLQQRAYRRMTIILTTCWGIYLSGYFLTVTPIDFNWIHVAFTITDLVAIIGIGLTVYFTNMKSVADSSI